MASQDPRFVLLGMMLLQCVVSCLALVALYDIAARTLRLGRLLAFCMAVLMLGSLGYLCFWMAYANYTTFGAVKIALLALLMIRFGLVIYQRRAAEYVWLSEPLIYVSLFCFSVVSLGFSNGGIDDYAVTARYRFSDPLPGDNTLPFIVAMALKIGHPLSPMAGDWLASDRPPLQTGLYLLLNLHNDPLVYQIVASWLQATFLLGVWALAVAVELSTAVRRLLLLACCLLPTTILNTFFVWPKVLPVGYLMLLFTLLFCYRPQDDRERGFVGVLIGGFAALAMLSHGGSAFALIGFAAMVVVGWQWPAWRTVIYAVPTLLCFYTPWLAFQSFIDPPGNRLLKWHLAGVQDIDRRGLFETMQSSYGALSWHDYLQGRLHNLTALVGNWPQHLRDLALFVFNQDADLARSLRTSDFASLLPSLHGYSVALIIAIAMVPFVGAWPIQRRAAFALLGAALGTGLTSCILLFIPGSAVNHQGTYALQVMVVAAIFIVLGPRSLLLVVLFLALQIVTAGMLYCFVLPHHPAFFPLLAVSVIAMVTLIVFSLAPCARQMLSQRGLERQGAQ